MSKTKAKTTLADELRAICHERGGEWCGPDRRCSRCRAASALEAKDAALRLCVEHAEGSDGRSISARLCAIADAARSAISLGREGGA